MGVIFRPSVGLLAGVCVIVGAVKLAHKIVH